MLSFKIIFFAVIASLAFLYPTLVIGVCNALPLRCISLLQAVADWLSSAGESRLAHLGTSVLLNLTILLQCIMQILQKADRITTAAGNGAGLNFHPANQLQNRGDMIPFLHTVFQSMLQQVQVLIVSVKSLDAPSLIQQFALQLHGFSTQARGFVERAILFQWIIQKAMAMVMGNVAAARLIAYANITIFFLQYRLGRIALTLLIWLLGLLI